MTLRDDEISLRQMLDHAREALDLTSTRSRSDLDEQRLVALALIQLLQIVGEAASRVSRACRDSHPEIAWSEIIAFRNRLIHGYDTIDLDILWQILESDLPALVTQLDDIVSKEADE